jgi:hypothetical protein
LELDTTSLDGPVAKTIVVTSNDPQERRVSLQLQASVWWPIKVVPRSAFLNLKAESATHVPAMIRIHSNLEGPLALSHPACTPSWFAAELITVQAGKEYQLAIRASPPLETNLLKGQVQLVTSAPQVPLLNIPIFAVVQPVLTVMPATLSLPGGPLLNPVTYTVSIRNNGTHPLELSDPVINANHVQVSVREVQPGRLFVATLTFAPGFKLIQNEETALSIKSNHPRFPVITVPFVQWSAITTSKQRQPAIRKD